MSHLAQTSIQTTSLRRLSMSDFDTGSISQPSSKRPRTDSLDTETGPSPPNPLEQKSDPWFEDGNIIITTATKTFRVYRGILAESSPIFRDMFDLSQPHDAVGGCPIVHLLDDPEDVRSFLKAISQPSFWLTSENLRSFYVIAAFVRLGKKYEVEYLLKEALSILIRTFPSTLQLFNSADRGVPMPQSQIVDTINFARQHNILRLLPAAFYELCRNHDLKSIFEGSTRPDSSLAVLSREDQQICAIGRQALISAQVKQPLQWVLSRDYWCSLLKCNSAKKVATAVYLGSKIVPMTASDITDTKDMCSSCSGVIKNTHEQARYELWEMLPSIFGLPEWKELCAQCDDFGNFDADYSFSK